MRTGRWLATAAVTWGMLVGLAVEPTDAQPRPRPAAKKTTAKPHAAKAKAKAIDALSVQVALDRAGFSVGEIDGRGGGKTRKARQAFQQTHGLSGSAAPDPVPPTVSYTVTEDDANGPFVEEIPRDPAAQGALPALGYRSIEEMLAERFHASPALLRRLNPRARRPLAAGVTLTVPNVDPLVPPSGSGRKKQTEKQAEKQAAKQADAGADAQAMEVVVSKDTNDLVALDASGAVIFYAPVSSGSKHDPLPIGDWVVRGVYPNPRFFYNPDLFWDADAANVKTRIAPGPNNPVGFIWIDLDRPHYGLHGTPEPSSVGVTQSHGCVRLTNWDALRLAALVRDGTRVSFRPTLPPLSPNVTTSAAGPAPAATPASPAVVSTETSDDGDPLVRELQARHLDIPVPGVRAAQLVPSFRDARTGHVHEALDILSPRGTPVIAVEDGTIVKLFLSKPGGKTIYQFDPTRRFAYYYAHLDRYAEGLKEGQAVRRGETIGFVGSTGNADAANPHLHFGIFLLTPERRWWKGTAIDPFAVLRPSPEPPPGQRPSASASKPPRVSSSRAPAR
jgi:lipoprotein-anchoring transpeptidase ErfK/SrfK